MRSFSKGSQKPIYNLRAFYWTTHYNAQKHNPDSQYARGQRTQLKKGRRIHFLPQLSYLPVDEILAMSYKCLPELDSRTNL